MGPSGIRSDSVLAATAAAESAPASTSAVAMAGSSRWPAYCSGVRLVRVCAVDETGLEGFQCLRHSLWCARLRERTVEEFQSFVVLRPFAPLNFKVSCRRLQGLDMPSRVHCDLGPLDPEERRDRDVVGLVKVQHTIQRALRRPELLGADLPVRLDHVAVHLDLGREFLGGQGWRAETEEREGCDGDAP